MLKLSNLVRIAVVALTPAWLPSPAQAQIPPDVTLDPVAGGLTFSTPVGLKHAGDGSGRRFIVELGGTVQVIEAGGSVLGTPFVDIDPIVRSGNERGLLDIAFHPEYGLSGAPGESKFYLHFSSEGGAAVAGTRTGDTVIAEFTDNGNPSVAVTAPDRIILTVTQDFANHNGGQMRFGPDGYLYIALGDGGSGGDPCNRAQTIDPNSIQTGGSCRGEESVALLGKMLRIDVDNTTPAGPNNLCGVGSNAAAEYAVPAENPFFGQADRCGEVLLYGLRNPWRWSFDRQTQDLWIGDVGQNVWEEVDLIEWPLAGGENLGWRPCEAGWIYPEPPGGPSPCDLAGSVLPVLEYDRTETPSNDCSVTGGYRYRGPVTSLRGLYVYGDYCSGEIWFADQNGGDWSSERFDSIGFGLRSFGEDEQGNLYAISGSTLLRFNGDISDLVFENGFETP